MKPPLTKFRLGELFGSKGNEMTGFIKSLSYTVPDTSPWEIQKGRRVPKYITADIGFQVIRNIKGISVNIYLQVPLQKKDCSY